jgi:Tfp pilus assembly protein FimT
VQQEAIMKITAAIAMSLALAVGAQAAGKVRVYVNSSTYVSFFVLARAEAIASQIFATAGVALEWRAAGSAACRNSDQARTVVLDFEGHTAPSEHPGAMAYALPYQGSHIVVLFDRIARSAGGPRQVSTILAHVMAHEIAHLLEGVARHSQTGLMKAHWDRQDFMQMGYNPLPFAPEDIEMIQRGLRVSAVGATPAVPPATAATIVELR